MIEMTGENVFSLNKNILPTGIFKSRSVSAGVLVVIRKAIYFH